MTALLCSATDDGFVIGADGMRQRTDGSVRLDAQKVFPLQTDGVDLACGWAGIVGNDLVEFAAVTKKAFGITATQSKHPCDYIENLVETVHRSIPGNFWPVFHPTGKELTLVIFAGYFKGEPILSKFQLAASMGRPEHLEGCRGVVPVTGSETVFQEFKPRAYKIKSLEHSREFVEDYIRECSERRGIEPDCAGIGGHIHIAQITPDGFSWLIEPKTGE